MRKIKVLAVMLAFLIVNVVAAVGSAAPMTSVECRELVGKAYQKLGMMENYHMTMGLIMSTSFQDKKVNMMATGECDFQAKPLRMKNVMTMTVNADAKVDEQEVVQYLEQTSNGFVIYTFANNQWVKRLMTMPRFDQRDEYEAYGESIKNVTPLEETADLIKSVTPLVETADSIQSVTPVEETADSIIVDVIVDGEIWKKTSERISAFADMRSAKLMAGLVNELGEITYRMTINKKTAAVAKIDLDLSDSMIKIGRSFTESRRLPAAEKVAINEVLDNMKVFMSIDFSQFNQLPAIVIPQAAKEAREIPPVPAL